jgi:glutamate-1-semialdehyde 2,1-aminomutase
VTSVVTKSELLYGAATRLVPGGTHSNSRLRDPYPLYFERAEGPYLFDVDGNRYLDFTMGNGAVALGHAHPAVNAAVADALAAGLTTGYETGRAIEAVELLAAIVPGFGKARFANTGTEAVMHALRIARAATGRDRVAKAEGAYHGWYDDVWVSCWGAPAVIGPAERPASPLGSVGLSAHASETLVVPFNDLDATEHLLREHGSELAAVIVEPVLIDLGWIPARPDYLEGLRRVTADLGVLLVFDELLTGFRVAPGGARELYGVMPDLTLYGKALANGFPLAAVEGRPDLLDLTDATAGGTVSYVGTFNGHAIALAAAVASLTLFLDGTAQARLQQLTERLQAGLRRLGEEYRVEVVAAGGGGHFQPYFTAGPVVDYRSALAASPAHYAAFTRALARHDILVAEKPLLHSALSLAHAEHHVDALLAAAEEAFAEIAGARE